MTCQEPTCKLPGVRAERYCRASWPCFVPGFFCLWPGGPRMPRTNQLRGWRAEILQLWRESTQQCRTPIPQPFPWQNQTQEVQPANNRGHLKDWLSWPRPTNFVNRFACWWITSKSNPLDETTQPEIHLLHQRASKVISNLNAG